MNNSSTTEQNSFEMEKTHLTSENNSKHILCLCLSAGIQKTIIFDNLLIDQVNRSKSYEYKAAGKAVNSARILTQLSKAATTEESYVDLGENSVTTKSTGATIKTTVVCPLGKNNAEFWMQLAKEDNLTVKNVLIPGFTRECCTLLDFENHTTTELIVEEPVLDNYNAPEDELISVLENSLTEHEQTSENTTENANTIQENKTSPIKSSLDQNNKTSSTNEELQSQNNKTSSTNRELQSQENKTSFLLFAGSRPKIWNSTLITRIAEIAKKHKIPVMVDFKGNDLHLFMQTYIPEIIKINEKEFIETFPGGSYTLRGDVELADAISEQSEKLGNIIVVTRGKECTIAADKGKIFYCDTDTLQPINTIGCGDSFNAGFLHEYIQTGNIQQSLEKGTWAASKNAMSVSPGSLW